MRLRRPELLLCALLAGILGQFTRAYWPLDQNEANLVRLVFWLIGLVWLVRAFTARTEPPEPPRWRRIAWRAASLPVVLIATLALGLMHASGYLTALVLSPLAAGLGLVVETGGLAACAWLAWRRPATRPRAMAASVTLLFAGSFLFVGLTSAMWGPPDPAVCESAASPPEVTRLTPAEWAAEPSQPFSLLHIPEEQGLMAAFKMSGSGVLSFWDTPQANRVIALSVDAPTEVEVTPFTGQKLPLHMAYKPGARELLVTRQGPGEHSVDLLGLDAFPAMSLKRTVVLDFAPHEVVKHPTAPRYGVFGQHGEFLLVNEDTLAAEGSLSLARGGGHEPFTLYTWHAPGTSKVYVSLLLYPLAEIDMDTLEVRWSEARFGGGQLTGHGDTVYETDLILDRVHVIDRARLTVTHTIDLDYTPRAIHADAERDLLMVGGWLGGHVSFYRLSTLEPLDRSIWMGPYLRDLAFDPKRGLLFSASKCGVYQADLNAWLGGAP